MSGHVALFVADQASGPAPDRDSSGIGQVAPGSRRQQQVQQVVVGQDPSAPAGPAPNRERRRLLVEEALDEQVVSACPGGSASAAFPEGAFVNQRPEGGHWRQALDSGDGQTARRTISSLIFADRLGRVQPLGQTSTQFMIVWQRNRRYGSSRLSRRSPVAWSRLSAMKR